MIDEDERRDTQYKQAAAEFGEALARFVRAYETDPDQRRDLLQDIHFELWRSFSAFKGQCSVRTWVYRVAHNVGISRRLRRRKTQLVSLEDIADQPNADDDVHIADKERNLFRLYELIRQLAPPDDQVMLLYLEDLDATSIGEITGLSARAVATRIHRIKATLARKFG